MNTSEGLLLQTFRITLRKPVWEDTQDVFIEVRHVHLQFTEATTCIILRNITVTAAKYMYLSLL